MTEAITLSQTQIDDLIHLRLPEAKAVELLQQLTPERVNVDLLNGLIQSIQQTVVDIPEMSPDVLDCCGTGGSGQSIFNTSTAVAFVLAAGGVPVMKFGNRAISSNSGSFDFLECLGFQSNIQLEAMPELLTECNLVFLYAPQCYPTLAPFNKLRKSLGVRTVFNFLGPLLHPLNPAYRLLGVSHAGMQELMADYLQQYQPYLKRAFLVHHPLEGEQGLDEISPYGTTNVIDLAGGLPLQKTLLAFLNEAELPTIANSPEDNAKLFLEICQNESQASLAYELICVNAGAGFTVFGKTQTVEDGIRHAKDLLKNGKVLETLNQCRRAYERYAI